MMNYFTTPTDSVDWSSVGGIIRGDHSSFLNNRRDVEFLGWHGYSSTSKFTYCDFKTTRALNVGHPYFHVSMNTVNGIVFQGCNFEYAAGSAYSGLLRGNGIISQNANYYIDQACMSSPQNPCYSVTPTVFKNLFRGIDANSSFVTITNSRFEDNLLDGIHFQTCTGFILNKNYFRMSEPSSNGIYLNSCKAFTVKNNTLEDPNDSHLTIGMYVYNSQGGAHQVYRNSFAGFNYALAAVNNNRGVSTSSNGLLMNCNDFTASPSFYDILMIGQGTGTNAPAVKLKQGETNANATVNNVVRNKYGASCVYQNMWYANGAGITTLTIEHGTNSGDPILSSSACRNAIVNAVAVAAALNYATHCPENLSSNGGAGTFPQMMDNLTTYISAQRVLVDAGGRSL